MTNPVASLGARSLRLIGNLGSFGVFAGKLGSSCLITPPLRLRRIVDEVFYVGVASLAIVCISGGFVGMVLGLQGFHTLSRFGAEESLGSVVALTLVRELGPVVTALLVTGRAGSAIAAEIGSMVATQQLAGLRMLSVDPVHFVAAPKALAMIIAMPFLSALFIVFGLGGGWLVGVRLLGIDGGSYISGIESAIVFGDDVLASVLKSLVFGVLVALVATFRGYTAQPHSAGVSAATTGTVVVGSVWILILDYVFTALWGV